ncbi:HolB ATPase involved in DNA replication [uncultured Caudovirales phage]|uniref:Sliding-clamp-loader large subunit n=1 Tax=uncultured Caudovirales phage TaxID=2100421 RepID=A0A6J5T574_9CAUD|nr:HolB ATPase involved in DNA replication [uncultured Caudovirales phage]CAB4176437.1 HolB ATPase involved in DNA replication [uncultured Caudovirales phage]CAB4181842.1 HolB ATPase involved in DNA replication [uncultured Caudovirales phage]CAB4190098.1 HolB ATPase involved in DNA replication [uncultured Caudovirales phage]CAB4210590.1 HolB ATPase involved in DNA replication [uncultured Caudovirales phage]
MSGEYLWVEKFRPKTVSDCILPDRIKKVFQSYVDTANIPNLMLTGSAGVGKTTVAMAMCEEIGLNYMFINSSEERGIDMLRTKIRGYASTISLTGGRKVIILDEADYLTHDAQAALRGAVEEYSENCSFILTCNFKSRLLDALHSRCSVIDFSLKADEKPRMAAQLFQRLSTILINQKVEYDKQVLIKIVEKFFPDYRRTLNELQRYSSGGSIDAGTLAQISDVRKIADLVRYLKEGNFAEMRKWVVTNSDIEPSRIYRKVYDSLYEYFKPASIPQAVVILARYQYQSAFVADQEINLVACLTEIMVDCEYV